jgi:hypothetical protein
LLFSSFGSPLSSRGKHSFPESRFNRGLKACDLGADELRFDPAALQCFALNAKLMGKMPLASISRHPSYLAGLTLDEGDALSKWEWQNNAGPVSPARSPAYGHGNLEP